VVVGVLTGTAGGAGVLFSPILLSTGLRGRAFVGTTSSIALATHIGRVAGYASLGLFSTALVAPTVAVTLAIFAGNALGDRLRAARESGLTTILEYGTLVVCVALSVAGLG
jgi:hypothetical protein